MKKHLSYLITFLIASLQTLLVLIPFVFLLQAVENGVGEKNALWLQILSALLLSVLYAVFLIRRLYVKKGLERKIITKAYPDGTPYHWAGDLKKIWINERKILLTLVAINLLFFLVNLVDTYWMGRMFFSFALIPLYPIFYVQLVLPVAWGWCGVLVMPIVFFVVLSLFRKRWYRDWGSHSEKTL